MLVSTRTGVGPGGLPPPEFRLMQNYPNPFNASTEIAYRLPATAPARLTVYDLLGREVAVLVDQPQRPGDHSVRFNAGTLASGVYLYRLQAGGNAEARRMLLLK